MKPNPSHDDPDELEMQPIDRELYLRSKNQPAGEAKPKSGPAPVQRPKSGPQTGSRPKTGPAPSLRPKTGPLQNMRRKTGPVPLPNAFPTHDAEMDLSMEPGHAVTGPGGPRELIDDGPPPSEKVDFENLPEFVKQRQMLKTVRIVGIFAALLIALAIGFYFYVTFWGAKKAIEPIINPDNSSVENNNRPLEETK